MIKTRLTIQESDRLIKLGIAPTKASLTQVAYDENLNPKRYSIFNLPDVIDLLPKKIKGEVYGTRMELWIRVDKGHWTASYSYIFGDGTIYEEHKVDALDMIYAVYELLIRLLEKKIIKKEI